MRLVIAFIGIAIIATFAVAGTQASLENAGENEIVVNETFTPDAGNVTTLDDSNIQGAYYDGEVAVFNETDTRMEPGVDYRWYAGNATIKTLQGGGLDGDANATVTYRYQETTATQRQLAGVLAQLPRVMAFLLPLGAFLALIAFARG